MTERTRSGRSVDLLADLFDSVHVEAATAARLELAGPSLSVAATHQVVLYVVLRGRLAVESGTASVELGEGDVLCLPRGPAHQLRSMLARETAGSVALVSAQCVLSDSERNPLLQTLPVTLSVSPGQWTRERWLEPTVELLVREATGANAGARVVVARMLELLLIQLVRTYVATTPEQSQGWLRALSDAQIGTAIGMIHERPAEEFSVAGLAQAVGMSRSAFASQFTRLVGEPPLHYVARWRMLRAAQLLKENRLTLAEIASAVGYESEAAFSKAFKRWAGLAPGLYRRERGVSELLVPSRERVGHI